MQDIQGTFLDKTPSSDWVIFHDESNCRQENFLYHGFLFVKRSEGRRILNEILDPNEALENNYAKWVHFTDLRGLQGTRACTAVHWVDLARRKWLIGGSVRFYSLGINLNNIKYTLYRDSKGYADELPSKRERIYRRFYEIGLTASLAWFQIDPATVSHLYYDAGKQDIDQFNRSLKVCGTETTISGLESDCLRSGQEISKFLQLTDVLLGTVRKTFTPLSPSVRAQARCVATFHDVVERQLRSETKYNPKSRYWRRFCLSFFPSTNDLTPEEFFARDMAYYQKTKDAFYERRKTHREQAAERAQLTMFK